MAFDLRDRARIETAFWEFKRLSEVIFKMDQVRQWLVEVQSVLSSELKDHGIPILGNVPIEDELPLHLRQTTPVEKRAYRKRREKDKRKKRK